MKFWHWVERGTFAAGLLGVSIWCGSIAERVVLERWQNWVFDRQLQGQPAGLDSFLSEEQHGLMGFLAEEWPRLTGFLSQERQRLVGFVASPARQHAVPAPAPQPLPATRPVPDRSLIGRLSIPRLRVSAMVREGVGESTLRVALGHIPGTAVPGTPGNVGLAGHRDTLFRPLRQIRRDDLIRLETLRGTYIYRVEKTEIVWPKNVSVLRFGDQPELTLVTCYPFYYVGAAPKRFVVQARQISVTARPGPEPDQFAKPRTTAIAGQLAAPSAAIAPVRFSR